MTPGWERQSRARWKTGEDELSADDSRLGAGVLESQNASTAGSGPLEPRTYKQSRIFLQKTGGNPLSLGRLIDSGDGIVRDSSV
jgi:hypothetical protein